MLNIKKYFSKKEEQLQRPKWDNQMEYLMSCIATSVGLGNVWRFPFVAYQNGGGAFLIPYIVVLFLVGKPMYFLECVLGQFSSRNSVKFWSLCPAMKGTGFAQAVGCSYVLSYYVVIVALCLYYLIQSFRPALPWAACEPEWPKCVASELVDDDSTTTSNDSISSAEYYFIKSVIKRRNGIKGGIGYPLWDLTLCLFVSWFLIFIVVSRGVKSSGKAAYFLAIFPYAVMILLFITTVFLPGAGAGILFFLTPQWSKLIVLDVWYAAVTQVFFSLSVCTGAIIMFSSYNSFRVNVYRNALIVTTLDTLTSLLSGMTIFGILGNLAHVLSKPIDHVIGSGGTGLAFVSYPDAIAKTYLPQLYSVLFFLMMSVLGVGSSVALLSTVNTVLMDSFPRVRIVFVSAFSCSIGFLVGLVYVTPGGQYVLELVDYYGGTFLVLFSAIAEIIGVCWIYGLENLCLDIEFMLHIHVAVFWRLCWGILTPAMMVVVFIYAVVSTEALLYGGYYVYPHAGYVWGYMLLFVGIILVPVFILKAMFQNRTGNCLQTVKQTFKSKPTWGPRDNLSDWTNFKRQCSEERQQTRSTWWRHVARVLTGAYRRGKKLT